jgi:hypothetical protein
MVVLSSALDPQPQSSPKVIEPKHSGLTLNPDFPNILNDCNDIIQNYAAFATIALFKRPILLCLTGQLFAGQSAIHIS